MTAAIVIAGAIFGLGIYVAIIGAADVAHGVGQWMRDRRRRRAVIELPRAVWRRR